MTSETRAKPSVVGPVFAARASEPLVAPAQRTARAPREPIASETLFAGAREVQISHGGVVYRLRQTALGKLILTK